jgi:hypothetical protein
MLDLAGAILRQQLLKDTGTKRVQFLQKGKGDNS